jgi:hypothetical protein
MEEHLSGEVQEAHDDELSNGAVADPSIMESLRARHRELQEKEYVDLEIPGFRGELLCRYRLLDSREVAKIGKRARKQSGNDEDGALIATMDALISSCVEFYYRHGDGSMHPLSQSISQDAPPVRYDASLANFLGLDATTAREVCLGVFGGEGHDLSVLLHGRQLQRWMADTSQDVSDDFMGGI